MFNKNIFENYNMIVYVICIILIILLLIYILNKEWKASESFVDTDYVNDKSDDNSVFDQLVKFSPDYNRYYSLYGSRVTPPFGYPQDVMNMPYDVYMAGCTDRCNEGKTLDRNRCRMACQVNAIISQNKNLRKYK